MTREEYNRGLKLIRAYRSEDKQLEEAADNYELWLQGRLPKPHVLDSDLPICQSRRPGVSQRNLLSNKRMMAISVGILASDMGLEHIVKTAPLMPYPNAVQKYNREVEKGRTPHVKLFEFIEMLTGSKKSH